MHLLIRHLGPCSFRGTLVRGSLNLLEQCSECALHTQLSRSRAGQAARGTPQMQRVFCSIFQALKLQLMDVSVSSGDRPV